MTGQGERPDTTQDPAYVPKRMRSDGGTTKRTSIPVSPDTLARLKGLKPDGTTWPDFMADVVASIEGDLDPEDLVAEQDDMSDLIEEVRKLREDVDHVPGRAADLVTEELTQY